MGKYLSLHKKKSKVMKQIFEVEILPKAVEFLENLDEKTREKVYYNIRKSQFVQDNELFKKLNDLIWEFKTLYNNNTYRLFAFWDNTEEQNVLVVATHGILKKTQKTPPKRNKKSRRNKKTIYE